MALHLSNKYLSQKSGTFFVSKVFVINLFIFNVFLQPQVLRALGLRIIVARHELLALELHFVKNVILIFIYPPSAK